MEPVWINKIDVARRQIVEAVTLFFEERDPVVIHTIVCSAHQILVDVGKGKGICGALKNPERLSREEFKSYLRTVNAPYNFFKHADNDPEGRLNIAPIKEFTSDFILDAIVILQLLSNDLPLEGKVFWAWFVGSKPGEFEDCPEGGGDQEHDQSGALRLGLPDNTAVSNFTFRHLWSAMGQPLH